MLRTPHTGTRSGAGRTPAKLRTTLHTIALDPRIVVVVVVKRRQGKRGAVLFFDIT